MPARRIARGVRRAPARHALTTYVASRARAAALRLAAHRVDCLVMSLQYVVHPHANCDDKIIYSTVRGV